MWLLSLRLHNASIVDILWGPGFAVVGWVYFLMRPGAPSGLGILVVVLATVWALRLSLHIGRRNAGAGEDFRYAKWREESGPSFWWVSLFKVFLLQALVLWVVSSPLLLAQAERARPTMNVVEFLGLAVCAAVVGLVADSSYMLFGLLRYPESGPWNSIAPIWIIALWVGFALTLNHSLSWLKGRPWLAAVMGAVSAPFSYWIGATTWKAVEYAAALPLVTIVLAVSWALMTPLLTSLAQRGRLTPARARA